MPDILHQITVTAASDAVSHAITTQQGLPGMSSFWAGGYSSCWRNWIGTRATPKGNSPRNAPWQRTKIRISEAKPGQPLDAATKTMIRESDLALGLATSGFASPFLIEEPNAADQSRVDIDNPLQPTP